MFSGTAEPGLNLIRNAESSVFPDNAIGFTEVIGCSSGHAAHSLNGLRNEPRDDAGRGIPNQLPDVLRCPGRNLLG